MDIISLVKTRRSRSIKKSSALQAIISIPRDEESDTFFPQSQVHAQSQLRLKSSFVYPRKAGKKCESMRAACVIVSTVSVRIRSRCGE
jgi:hypothetical protein